MKLLHIFDKKDGSVFTTKVNIKLLWMGIPLVILDWVWARLGSSAVLPLDQFVLPESDPVLQLLFFIGQALVRAALLRQVCDTKSRKDRRIVVREFFVLETASPRLRSLATVLLDFVDISLLGPFFWIRIEKLYLIAPFGATLGHRSHIY